MTTLDKVLRTRTLWWTLVMVIVVEVTCLSGPHVCMVKQKYNVTKRVKYRAPMSVRTYEWCFAMPPRCSKWSMEMKDLTRLETEERTADMAVCCPGYKMKDISCIPICPDGKTGAGCSDDCPPNKWGPNCVNECKTCIQGTCSPITGECHCRQGWQGERCDASLTTSPGAMMESLTTARPSITTASTKPTTPTLKPTTNSPNFTTSTTNSLSPTTRRVSKNSRIETTTEMRNTKEITLPHDLKPTVYNNETLKYFTRDRPLITEPVSRNFYPYNRTESSSENRSFYEMTTPVTKAAAKSIKSTLAPLHAAKTTNEVITSTTFWTSTSPKSSEKTTTKEITTLESKSSETTMKTSTAKFKPREIWIRPAQKGEHFMETKARANIETKEKFQETPIETTTPKTIVVSIIPTSVSYANFKRIVLTTASFISQRKSSRNSAFIDEKKQMIPITVPTVKSTTESTSVVNISKRNTYLPAVFYPGTTQTKIHIIPSKESRTTPISPNKITNSMKVIEKSSSHLLSSSTNEHNSSEIVRNTTKYYTIPSQTTSATNLYSLIMAQTAFTEHASTTKQPEIAPKNVTVNPLTDGLKQNGTNIFFIKKTAGSNERNASNSYISTTETTKNPTRVEENFDILTEPEHITAVMGDKGNERSSIDLISVISIAGGVMMAIITVAVIIVMIERCKKPRYEDDRKYNEIRMQVVVDDNDINDMPPPPYVRSIFHTPLPDPPSLEKCHYQPISTLDRNLKQFMRPVVVQTISPLMLENFRGILECHYDHLPRRSHDCDSMQMRSSITPSVDECSELLPKRTHSLMESTIEAMKCEATFDVIDSTTSEPLYAEIPCWRPPLEHAVEVVNLSGEAVTEL